MARPTLKALQAAAELLDHEACMGDSEARTGELRSVAAWIRQTLETEAQEKMIRDAARNAGIPVSALKRAMKARS